MIFRYENPRVKVGFSFAAAVALLFVFDKSGTAPIAVAACIAHECGHLLLLMVFGETPDEISFEMFGMSIKRSGNCRFSLRQEAAAALAGPITNMAIAAVTACAGQVFGNTNMLRPAALNLGIAVFNLLPVEPLDGSKVLYYILCLFFEPEKADRAVRTVSLAVLLPLAAAGFFVLIRSGYNFTLLIAAAYLIALFIKLKDPS